MGSYSPIYRQAHFLFSAAKLSQLPPDEGIEVAFVGRSNAGKSSALNAITEQKKLAKTSKTPGCTQLINLFGLDDDDSKRLIDLPGYGYAKVSKTTKASWQRLLSTYLQERKCLKALVLLMDIRHPLKEYDQSFIHWALEGNRNIHIILTKADKLSRTRAHQTLQKVRTTLKFYHAPITLQTFSSLNKTGVLEAQKQLDEFFGVGAKTDREK